ncbi:MAG: copper transporter [Bifidobacteriaceae bacterium]|jgi:hypothetical protein|nr:copper transporter [Bifidobacteriaceae bacterium]
MINFRYHLVSLVSVFMALAVGIVLGAGPLKDPITENLDAQVTSLRDEKDALREDLAQAEADTAYREDVLAGLTPSAVTAMLPGTRVALISVGDVDGRVEEAFEDALRRAGGSVSAHVGVEDAWWRAEASELHRAAVEVGEQDSARTAPSQRPSTAPPASPDPAMVADDATLARGIVASLFAEAVNDDGPRPLSTPSRDADGGGAYQGDLAMEDADGEDASETQGNDAEALTGIGGGSDGETGQGETSATLSAQSTEHLNALDKVGFIDLGAVDSPADALIILLADDFSRKDAEPNEPVWEREDRALLSLIAAAGEVSPGTVVVAPSAAQTDPLARVRADETIAAAVSTVDGVSIPALTITSVWALAADLRGVTGHFGASAAESGGRLLGPRLPLAPLATRATSVPPSAQQGEVDTGAPSGDPSTPATGVAGESTPQGGGQDGAGEEADGGEGDGGEGDGESPQGGEPTVGTETAVPPSAAGTL